MANDGAGMWTFVAVGIIMVIGLLASIYLILDALGVLV